MKRIAGGIFQLVTPFPEFSHAEALALRADLEAHPRVTKELPYVLPYLIVGRGEAALGDCGWNTDAAHAALAAEVRAAGGALAVVGTLALTHTHPDHCGMAGRLQAETGCTVWLHEREAAVLGSRHAAPDALVVEVERWLGRHGVPAVDAARIARASLPVRGYVAPLTPDRTLRGGEALMVGAFVFEVLWTPGHAPGHVCLYERNHRVLLAGDHVLPTITPNVSLHCAQGSSLSCSYPGGHPRTHGHEAGATFPTGGARSMRGSDIKTLMR